MSVRTRTHRMPPPHIRSPQCVVSARAVMDGSVYDTRPVPPIPITERRGAGEGGGGGGREGNRRKKGREQEEARGRGDLC